jgi:hypothetical protein
MAGVAALNVVGEGRLTGFSSVRKALTLLQALFEAALIALTFQ